MELIKMRNYLHMLMESFSSIIEVESTVIDADPITRVAWTGEFYRSDMLVYDEDGNINANWQISYTMKVIKSGKPIVAIDTRDYVSQMPKLRDFKGSEWYSLILYPIYVDSTLEGVLVLASFNQEQQRVIIEKQEQLLKYLEGFSGLIASKVKEERALGQIISVKNQLQSVIDTLQDGILLYSRKEGILQINQCAENYLHFKDEAVKDILLKEVIAAAKKTLRKGRLTMEIHKNVEAAQFSIHVQTYLVGEGGGETVLCVINPFSQIQQQILQSDKEDVEREIVFSSYRMREIVSRVEVVAQNSLNVLITGESGTGKELFARMIHSHGARKDKPFVAFNCAAIPETLLESELFGYEEGAFTGAKRGGKIGKFLLANHGTLFLDEIGEMPLYLQAKLLRVLSERKVDRVGGKEPVDIDVRIVAATNRNLEEMIGSREFREDLYYRLSVVPFHIPALRERKEDIFVLSRYFIEKYNKILGKNIRKISDDTLRLFQEYDWPGNVRELENSIEYMMTFENSTYLSSRNIPGRIRAFIEQGGTSARGERNVYQPLKKSIEEYEGEILEEILKDYQGPMTKAQVQKVCDMLQISVASWYRKLARLKQPVSPHL